MEERESEARRRREEKIVKKSACLEEASVFDMGSDELKGRRIFEKNIRIVPSHFRRTLRFFCSSACSGPRRARKKVETLEARCRSLSQRTDLIITEIWELEEQRLILEMGVFLDSARMRLDVGLTVVVPLCQQVCWRS